MSDPVGEAAKAIVRRNTEEVQGGGNWVVFDELFADDFVDHTPQPGVSADKDGVRLLYKGSVESRLNSNPNEPEPPSLNSSDCPKPFEDGQC
jgi:hypothetical protein